MAKKSTKVRETERYEILVHGWEVYHHLHAQINMAELGDCLYWEGSCVTLHGQHEFFKGIIYRTKRQTHLGELFRFFPF